MNDNLEDQKINTSTEEQLNETGFGSKVDQESVKGTEKIADTNQTTDTRSQKSEESEETDDTQTDKAEDSEETVLTAEEENAQLKEQLGKLTEELARSNADYYNLQKEYSNYVRRSKSDISTYKMAGIESVVESLLSVFDDIDGAKKHGDLTDGPFVSIINKIETTLKTNFKIERFGNVHDEFDPNIHEALLVTPNPNVEKEEIGDLIQSGWRIEEKVIRAAKVVVFTPAE